MKTITQGSSLPPPLAFSISLLLLAGFPLLAAEEKAAKVGNGVKEAALSTVTLTTEAESRLGIQTVPVEMRQITRIRTFGGEATIPAHAEGGQSIVSVMPLLTATDLIRIAEAQVDADGQVEQARISFEAARVAFERAAQLRKTQAGSERLVDESRAAMDGAGAILKTAQARRGLLSAPVLDVLNPKVLWIRTPVYVGDLARLDTDAEAQVGELAGAAAEAKKIARPVAAPPSANALASTVDLFYELPNEGGSLRLGQKVGVSIPLKGPAESLVVPRAAVVYDTQGGAWVYERTAPQTYTRRRVQVHATVGEEMILTSGPATGAAIARIGVAELFGTEFGTGK